MKEEKNINAHYKQKYLDLKGEYEKVLNMCNEYFDSSKKLRKENKLMHRDNEKLNKKILKLEEEKPVYKIELEKLRKKVNKVNTLKKDKRELTDKAIKLNIFEERYKDLMDRYKDLQEENRELRYGFQRDLRRGDTRKDL